MGDKLMYGDWSFDIESVAAIRFEGKAIHVFVKGCDYTIVLEDEDAELFLNHYDTVGQLLEKWYKIIQ